MNLKWNFLVMLFPLFGIIGCSHNISKKGENSYKFNSNLDQFEQCLIAIGKGNIERDNILGTGFIVSESGIVITAEHVLPDGKGLEGKNENLFAILPAHPKYETYSLKILKTFNSAETGKDIAILQIETDGNKKSFPYLQLGSNYSTGQTVIIGGFPKIFDEVFIWPIFRKGIISSTKLTFDGKSPMILLDIPSTGGFSGSPVIVQNDGTVIGVLRGTPNDKYLGFSLATFLDYSDIELFLK